MKKQKVELNRQEWGQVLDGLACRVVLYERTARYHETGFADGDTLEVRDAREAKNIAAHYSEIIGKIREQLRDS